MIEYALDTGIDLEINKRYDCREDDVFYLTSAILI